MNIKELSNLYYLSKEIKQKYMNVSNMLLNLFMEEHQNMQNIFKNER